MLHHMMIGITKNITSYPTAVLTYKLKSRDSVGASELSLWDSNLSCHCRPLEIQWWWFFATLTCYIGKAFRLMFVTRWWEMFNGTTSPTFNFLGIVEKDVKKGDIV